MAGGHGAEVPLIYLQLCLLGYRAVSSLLAALFYSIPAYSSKGSNNLQRKFICSKYIDEVLQMVHFMPAGQDLAIKTDGKLLAGGSVDGTVCKTLGHARSMQRYHCKRVEKDKPLIDILQLLYEG